MGLRGELYSTKAVTEKRTIFFNVKENRTGDLFLNIAESVKKPDGAFERHQIMVYEEDLEAFMHELNKSVLFLKKRRELPGTPTRDDGSDRDRTF